MKPWFQWFQNLEACPKMRYPKQSGAIGLHDFASAGSPALVLVVFHLQAGNSWDGHFTMSSEERWKPKRFCQVKMLAAFQARILCQCLLECERDLPKIWEVFHIKGWKYLGIGPWFFSATLMPPFFEICQGRAAPHHSLHSRLWWRHVVEGFQIFELDKDKQEIQNGFNIQIDINWCYFQC